MLDKKVVMCDFRNIKSGMLVKVREDKRLPGVGPEDICLVLDRVTIPRAIDEGSHEFYDPGLVVIARGKRAVISVDSVKEILS
jgi:hypothetical protein